MFIFGASNFHSRRTGNEKPAPKTGVDLWRQFLGRVSRASRFVRKQNNCSMLGSKRKRMR